MFELFKTALQHSEKVTLILNADADNLVVAIIADPKKDGVKVKPITIRGTYAEVDAKLKEALEMVFDKNSGAFSNAELVAKQAAKAAEEKTKTASQKPGSKGKAKPVVKAEEVDEEEEVDETDDGQETKEETVKEEKPETPAVSQPDLFASNPPPTKPKKAAVEKEPDPIANPVVAQTPVSEPVAPPAPAQTPADDMDIF